MDRNGQRHILSSTRNIPIAILFRRAAFFLAWGLALGLAAAQAQLFTAGFRLTADDVTFHFWMLRGLPELMHQTWATAAGQGRIGHLAIIPVNALGAYFSDSYGARVLFVLFHFLSFLVAAFYMSAIARRNITLPLFLVMIAIHPLAYHHLPPTSYPLQISIGILILLSGRLYIHRFRSQSYCGSIWSFTEIILAIIFAIILFTSEYIFVFATALIITERFSSYARMRFEGLSRRQSAKGVVFDGSLGIDVVPVAISLTAYVLFRLFYSSDYDGTSVEGLSNISGFSLTLLKHVFAGTIAPHLDLAILGSPVLTILFAISFGMGVIGVALMCVRSLDGLSAPWVVSLGGGMFAAYVTAPIAASPKYQAWCMGTVNCPYLDSRLSYFGVALALVATTAALVRLSSAERVKALLRIVACVALGVLGALTYLQNWNRAEDMRDFVSAWGRATELACTKGPITDDDIALLAYIDPKKRVQMHRDFPISGYWRLYIEDRSAACQSQKR